jgi:hypothetical protein
MFSRLVDIQYARIEAREIYAGSDAIRRIDRRGVYNILAYVGLQLAVIVHTLAVEYSASCWFFRVFVLIRLFRKLENIPQDGFKIIVLFCIRQ